MTPDAEAEAVLAARAADPLPPGPYLVCARTIREAVHWSHKHRLARWDWWFVDDEWQLCGHHQGTLVVLNGGIRPATLAYAQYCQMLIVNEVT